MSPEEQAAEKQRLQQIQKDADLEVAKALFGGSHKCQLYINFLLSSVHLVTTGSTSIDEMNPKTPEEFEQLLEALKNKFHRLEVRSCLPLSYFNVIIFRHLHIILILLIT